MCRAGVDDLVARDVVLNVDNHPTAVAAANQANELAKKGDVAGAIRLYTAAFKADPSMYVAIYERGALYTRQHQYEQAIADFDAALRVSRNGKQAVADAEMACRIDSWDNWDYIDTLAPAYAEAGDFEKAIKFEQKAIRKTVILRTRRTCRSGSRFISSSVRFT